MSLAKEVTSKRTYLLKSIPEDEDSVLYLLYYRSYCPWSVTLISEIKSGKLVRCDNLLGEMFFKWAILYFWPRQPRPFYDVIFNQWEQLSADSVKEFFWKCIVTS